MSDLFYWSETKVLFHMHSETWSLPKFIQLMQENDRQIVYDRDHKLRLELGMDLQHILVYVMPDLKTNTTKWSEYPKKMVE